MALRLLPRSLAVLAAAGLALTAAACGDDDGRPSVSEVSERIQESDSDVTEAQADCTAEAVVDSEISDEGIRTLLDADPTDADLDSLDLSDEDEAAFTAVFEDILACQSAE